MSAHDDRAARFLSDPRSDAELIRLVLSKDEDADDDGAALILARFERAHQQGARLRIGEGIDGLGAGNGPVESRRRCGNVKCQSW